MLRLLAIRQTHTLHSGMDAGLTVFVSYARDSAIHLAWVTNLASMLDARLDCHVVFDQYDLHAGKDLTHFMGTALDCDRIVVVVTPEYASKSRERLGGVGYETSIISAEVLRDQLSARVVPALRLGDTLPDFLRSKVFVDFRDDEAYVPAFAELVSALHGLSPAARPEKGSNTATEESVGQVTHMAHRPPPLDVPAPVVVACLPMQRETTAYFGPIELENVGDRDAFNIDVADVSNRAQLARFSRVARLRPGEKANLVPVIDGAEETRNGMPDLYRFAWVGQVGRIHDLIVDGSHYVPKSDTQRAVERTFVAPIRISYIDAANRAWITHSELIFGRDRAGRQRLVIEFRRVELAFE
jgi:hypothetical protein